MSNKNHTKQYPARKQSKAQKQALQVANENAKQFFATRDTLSDWCMDWCEYHLLKAEVALSASNGKRWTRHFEAAENAENAAKWLNALRPNDESVLAQFVRQIETTGIA